MAVLQVIVPKGLFYFELRIEDKNLVTGSDIDVVIGERDATEPSVGASTREIYFAGIPVET